MSSRPVAVITGSGRRRLGYHVAKQLAVRGYDLVLHYHRSKAEALATIEELIALGVDAVALQADFANETETQKFALEAARHSGRVDVLVNTAAIWNEHRLEETSAGDVRAHFDVNVLSTFICTKTIGLAMAEQPDGGVIVNVGDWAESRPYLHHSAYFASKGSIPTLTRTFAVELAHRNPKVRVNCVLPGPVMLPDSMSEDERHQVIESTLLKRAGTPEEFAHAVMFLIENRFVTGVCLPVDGGRTIYA